MYHSVGDIGLAGGWSVKTVGDRTDGVQMLILHK